MCYYWLLLLGLKEFFLYRAVPRPPKSRRPIGGQLFESPQGRLAKVKLGLEKPPGTDWFFAHRLGHGTNNNPRPCKSHPYDHKDPENLIIC